MNFRYILFIGTIIIALSISCNRTKPKEKTTLNRPNVLVILADQWRAQATGYAGDPNVKTPNLDQLSIESINFEKAVSGMPVCSPFRASLLTGQRPLTHGVFMNDVQLDTNAVTLGKVFSNSGYDTGYIGKWHLDGHGRSQFIPPGKRRQGFEFWKANECTHNYNESVYFDNSDSIKKEWEGYDSFAQTDEAIRFMKKRKETDNPFLLILSWGTPHAPYHTAPEKYRRQYDTTRIILHDNVPESMKKKVTRDLKGYYAHITALDDMVGKIINNLKKTDQLKNTIIVFTSDHGDLLGSHAAYKKQQPFDESIRIPMLYYLPKNLGIKVGKRQALMNSEDIMPTILGLCDISIPKTVEGINYKSYMKGKDEIGQVALLSCIQPFGQWSRARGGREYRGIRTLNYTYARDLNGAWLMFDNDKDPFQLNNLINKLDYKNLQLKLENILSEKLIANGDKFLPGLEYIEKWNYKVDKTGTVPYTN